MSYSQTFNTTLTVTGSVSVSYPKSDSGGSTSASYSHTEQLEFVIEVDTDPVDLGVSRVHSSITELDAAVVAGANLQIREKREGAERVSTTVINEFNGYISGDIKQQMASLKSQIAARQALLHAEAEAAAAKQQQFLSDYRRIKERYSNLFQNLDKELERRVRAIDEPIFQLVRNSFAEGLKGRTTGAFTASFLGSAEGDQARQDLENTGVKRRNLDLLRLAGKFLVSQKELDHQIGDILTQSEADAVQELALPFVCVESTDKDGTSRRLQGPEGAAPIALEPDRVWVGQQWNSPSDSEQRLLEKSFLNLLGEDAEALDPREVEVLRTLWSECRPLTNE